MSDCMDYPQTLRKFANDYSFKDREEVYTNGSMLVPLFRIEQALDEHFMDIEKVQYKMDTDSAYECGYQQGRADAIDEFADYLRMSYDKGMRIMMAVAKTETEKFKIKAMYSQFISNIDDCVKFYKDMSELKP